MSRASRALRTTGTRILAAGTRRKTAVRPRLARSRLVALALSAALLAFFTALDARAEDESVPSIAVLETYGPGMPAASSAVTRQLYATIGRLGYRAVPESETARLTARRGPRILVAADLLAIARESHAAHAVQATLSSRGALYVATLTVANADGTRPAFASRAADAAALEGAVDALARSLFAETPTTPSDGGPAGAGPPAAFRLALQTEGAFGLSNQFFYNHFAGGRIDYAFTPRFALGAYVGYANLKGRAGRVSEVLPYLQLEYRLSVSERSSILVPLRFGTGYLPKNGPFMRVAAGPSFSLGRTVRLGFDLLAPTFVIVHDRTVVSLDVAAEVSVEL